MQIPRLSEGCCHKLRWPDAVDDCILRKEARPLKKINSAMVDHFGKQCQGSVCFMASLSSQIIQRFDGFLHAPASWFSCADGDGFGTQSNLNDVTKHTIFCVLPAGTLSESEDEVKARYRWLTDSGWTQLTVQDKRVSGWLVLKYLTDSTWCLPAFSCSKKK